MGSARGERVWSSSYLRLVSITPKISCRVNWVSDEWRHAVAFLVCCLESKVNNGRPAFAEHVPIYVHTYFIRCDAAEFAIQKPDGAGLIGI